MQEIITAHDSPVASSSAIKVKVKAKDVMVRKATDDSPLRGRKRRARKEASADSVGEGYIQTALLGRLMHTGENDSVDQTDLCPSKDNTMGSNEQLVGPKQKPHQEKEGDFKRLTTIQNDS